jgi:hypothetical protein
LCEASHGALSGGAAVVDGDVRVGGAGSYEDVEGGGLRV